eukprot:jgi/Tetstr1/422813/TSEL_013604.t1
MAANEAASEQPRTELTELLPLAVRSPSVLKPSGDADRQCGALLVVALHCRMVEAGFRKAALTSVETEVVSSWAAWNPVLLLDALRSPYSLVGRWNDMEGSVWLLEYTRDDAPGRFVLQCGLAKGMMIVCGIEAGNPGNQRMVSFRVEKYVPELARCRSRAWAGVLEQEGALSDMFEDTVLRPLVGEALRPPDFHRPGSDTSSVYLLGAAAALAAAAAAAALLLRRAT